MAVATAVVLPGQGSAPRDMGGIVREQAPDLHDLVLREVGADAFDRTEGSDRRMQPALVATVLCGWRRLRALAADGLVEWGTGPIACAGHSLGDVAALAVGGILSEGDAVRAAHERGRIMGEHARGSAGGAMVALVGSGVHELAAELHAEDLVLANDNAPGQVVLSGSAAAVERARARASDAGVRAIPMPFSVAGHSPRLERAAEEFFDALGSFRFGAPDFPVISSMTARAYEEPRKELSMAIARPVRWQAAARTLHGLGARRFIDTGPGHTMAGLVSKILDDVETPTVRDLEAAGV